jgi:hypothetical protein
MTETQEKVRDPAAVSAVGFIGIVFPEHQFWNGLYLHQNWIDAGPEVVERMRAVVVDRSDKATTAIPVELAMSSLTLEPIPGVKPEDQTLAGNMLGVIVDCASGKQGQDRKEALGRIYSAAGAFATLSGQRYFIITAQERRGGVHTKLDVVERSEIMMAQVMLEKPPEVYMTEKLRKMPEVQAIEAHHAAKRAKMT